jgi:hypothetical protein
MKKRCEFNQKWCEFKNFQNIFHENFQNFRQISQIYSRIFSPKIFPIILVKKATSFVQKNHWGSSTKQNDLMFCSKTNKKAP